MKGNIIKITIGENRKVKVTVPYNPIYIKKLKDIKGHRWISEKKVLGVSSF